MWRSERRGGKYSRGDDDNDNDNDGDNDNDDDNDDDDYDDNDDDDDDEGKARGLAYLIRCYTYSPPSFQLSHSVAVSPHLVLPSILAIRHSVNSMAQSVFVPKI